MTDLKLTLTPEEVQYLARTLQHALGESRVEVRRTHSVDFRDQVLAEEKLLRDLLKKLEECQ